MRGATRALCCVHIQASFFRSFIPQPDKSRGYFFPRNDRRERLRTSTRVAELHCCTRLHAAFSCAITLIPLFTSIFLLNRTEPDEIMVLLPTLGLTGSVWGDNWVRRQQLCSWINCCTELPNYCGSVCKPYNVCMVLTSWSPSSSNVHALLRAFLGQMIYRPSLQFTTVTSQLIIPFSQRSAYFFCACHSSLHDPFTRHTSLLYNHLWVLV